MNTEKDYIEEKLRIAGFSDQHIEEHESLIQATIDATKRALSISNVEGEIIVATKDIVREAVKESVSSLYDDVSDFANNRYMTGRDKEFEQLSEQQQNDIADEVIDYLLDE